MDERAWLLERSGTDGPAWAFFDGFGLRWTRDSLKAIRFSRREDAEQIVSICESEDVKATEHEWGERGSASPARAEAARNTADDYVAWVRYTEYSIVTCDSDVPGAFKVYRHPRQVPEETVSSPAHQEWLRERKSQDPLNPQPIAQPASRETVAEPDEVPENWPDEVQEALDKIWPNGTTRFDDAAYDRAVKVLCRLTSDRAELVAKTREEALKEAADVRPPRSAMKHALGDWYECGWNDAVIAYADALEAQNLAAHPEKQAQREEK